MDPDGKRKEQVCLGRHVASAGAVEHGIAGGCRTTQGMHRQPGVVLGELPARGTGRAANDPHAMGTQRLQRLMTREEAD